MKSISEGGSGAVYSALYLPLRERRIIKAIRKQSCLEECFHNEVNILKNLRHPAFPAVYDIFDDDDFYYIVKEYISGRTLTDYLSDDQSPALSAADIIDIIIKICRIVEYLHNNSRAVLILDLQPDNIIINNGQVYFIDFGSSIYENNVKNKKFHFGTLGYAAPEQFGIGTESKRTDIYAVGSLILSVCDSEVIREIGYRCTNLQPDKRYADISDVIRDLEICKGMCPGMCESTHKNKTNTIKKEKRGGNKNNIKVLSVIGTAHGAGATHLAISLVSYLNGSGKKAIYYQKYETGVPDGLKQYGKKFYCDNEGYHAGNCIFRYDAESILMSDEDIYLIADCGVWSRRKSYMGNKVIVTGCREWEYVQNNRLLALMRRGDVTVVYNMADLDNYRRVMEYTGSVGIRMPFYTDIYTPDCDFVRRGHKKENFLAQILEGAGMN